MGDTRIEPQPWMQAPETRAVLQALANGGAVARFVGGCVRDAILARPIADIDIATDAEPERVSALMQAEGFKVIPIGIEHGTVMAVVGRRSFEITTLREDVETDGRRAVVAFTTDWVADAARRDLTINALFLDPDGTVHDPFGGVADLHAGRVRFVGDARARIREDYLRLLRFFRFYAHYGRPPPDAAAVAASRELAGGLDRLSAERVRAEFLKLLAAPDPMPTLKLMAASDVLAHIVPDPVDLDALHRLVAVERVGHIAADPVRRLAVLAPRDAAGALGFARRLRLSNAERDHLMLAAAPPTAVCAGMGTAAARRALYRLGARTFRELVLTAWARTPDAAPDDRLWTELLATSDWRAPMFPLTGQDALDAGVARGPRVGYLLSAVEEWWVEGGFTAPREACLARLRGLAADKDG